MRSSLHPKAHHQPPGAGAQEAGSRKKSGAEGRASWPLSTAGETLANALLVGGIPGPAAEGLPSKLCEKQIRGKHTCLPADDTG